jgi:hypothetical protein
VPKRAGLRGRRCDEGPETTAIYVCVSTVEVERRQGRIAPYTTGASRSAVDRDLPAPGNAGRSSRLEVGDGAGHRLDSA